MAELAGVSPGTTTHHFDGRAALLRESFTAYLASAEDLFDMLSAASESEKAMAIAGVRKVLIGLVEREFADISLLRAEYELLLYASLDEALAKIAVAWESRITGAIAAVLERAGARRPAESARILINFTRGFEIERLLKPRLGAAEFDRRVTPLLKAICRPD